MNVKEMPTDPMHLVLLVRPLWKERDARTICIFTAQIRNSWEIPSHRIFFIFGNFREKQLALNTPVITRGVTSLAQHKRGRHLHVTVSDFGAAVLTFNEEE